MQIGAGSRQVPACPGGMLYTIRPGDSFFSLAQRFNTTVEAIVAANPGVDPDRLQVGQVICLPPGVTGPIPCPPVSSTGYGREIPCSASAGASASRSRR